MSSDALRVALERVSDQFDFGEYEVEAYLVILEHGQLSASEIAERTSIPQPRVYDTVRSLAEHGFVEVRESRPMQVLAIPPEESFAGIQSSLEDLVSDLERRYTEPTRQSEAVSLIRSRPTILRYLADVIESAEYELILSLTPDLLAEFESQLIDRREAGLTVELLLSPADGAPSSSEYDYNRVATNARARRGVTTPIVAVADGTYSIYTTQEALGNTRDRYGVIFNRSELGFLVTGFLSTVVWTSATTLATSDDLPFPRKYATIRRCVMDIVDREGPFYASIAGRDVKTGEPREVNGTVIDVAVGTNRETAAMTIETEDGIVDVGGQVAALEDVEAHVIRIGRDGPPGL